MGPAAEDVFRPIYWPVVAEKVGICVKCCRGSVHARLVNAIATVTGVAGRNTKPAITKYLCEEAARLQLVGNLGGGGDCPQLIMRFCMGG